jgi:hypothetical protein
LGIANRLGTPLELDAFEVERRRVGQACGVSLTGKLNDN